MAHATPFTRTRLARIAALTVVAALAAGACSGDDDSATTTAPTTAAPDTTAGPDSTVPPTTEAPPVAATPSVRAATVAAPAIAVAPTNPAALAADVADLGSTVAAVTPRQFRGASVQQPQSRGGARVATNRVKAAGEPKRAAAARSARPASD